MGNSKNMLYFSLFNFLFHEISLLNSKQNINYWEAFRSDNEPRQPCQPHMYTKNIKTH